nr:hypothetical protein [Pseudomonas syringae pv. actinidiae]
MLVVVAGLLIVTVCPLGAFLWPRCAELEFLSDEIETVSSFRTALRGVVVIFDPIRDDDLIALHCGFGDCLGLGAESHEVDGRSALLGVSIPIAASIFVFNQRKATYCAVAYTAQDRSFAQVSYKDVMLHDVLQVARPEPDRNQSIPSW